MKKYTASCHCGVVKVSFETEPLTEALQCNCSHCEKKGLLLTFLPTDQLLITGEENQTEYHFNKKVITHLFCKTCGVSVYTRAQMNGKEMSSINLHTIDDFEVEALAIKKYNGRDI
jgi:hypothetical protein